MSNRRDIAFDITKGIGIICVIIGHLKDFTLARIVFSFHMPLFFFVSGWFLTQKRSHMEYCKKRAHTLLMPYCFTSICLIALNAIQSIALRKAIPETISNAGCVLIDAIYGAGNIASKIPWGIGQIGAIWFLPALLLASIIVHWIISLTSKWSLQFVILFLIFSISWKSADYIFLPFDIQPGCCAALFLYVGWLTKQWFQYDEFRYYYNKYNFCIIPIGILAWLSAYSQNSFLDIACAKFPNHPYSIIMAFLIVFGIIRISKIIEKNTTLSKVLSFYGRHSLIFLCFHNMELDYIPWIKLQRMMIDRGMSIGQVLFIVFCLQMIICTVLVLICININFTRHIFGLPNIEKK